MALIKDRDTKRRDGIDFSYPVAASVQIFGGAMVGLNSAGMAIPAGPAAVCVVGIAQEHVDNRQGLAGAVPVAIRRGVFALTPAAGITNASYGMPVTATDDGTVALVTDTEVVAGVLRGVDDDGAWVEF